MMVNVKLRNGEMTGEVVEIMGQNKDIYKVNVNGEIFKFYQGPQIITEIEEKEETVFDQFTEFLRENGLPVDGYEDDDDGIFYIIEQDNAQYTVEVVLFPNGESRVNTVNTVKRERLAQSDDLNISEDPEIASMANEKSYKTLKGLKNYVKRYAL